MYKFIIYVCVAFFSVLVNAKTNQIDILGLTPGVSTSDQANAILVNNILPVGGHRLVCDIQYVDDKLSSLGCIFGDEEIGSSSPESNISIFQDLVIGFTKKFGPVNSSLIVPVRDGRGLEYKKNIVTWIDKRGNKLTMWSMLATSKEGFISLKSKNKISKDMAEHAESESKKKF